MKKTFILLIILVIFLPSIVKADGTDKYYIDVYINDDGSATMKELILFSGEYNYLERELTLKGNNKPFNDTAESFYETNIYNAESITNICASDVSKNYISNWLYIANHNDCFPIIDNGYKGLNGYYTALLGDNSNIKIYNQSEKNTAFYLEYTVTDLVVVHNDIAEILFNFKWGELITDYQVRVNLPKESNELRIFSHGPINGTNQILDKKTTMVNWSNLNRETNTDIRVVFDKELVPNATKKSNVNGLDNIIKFETKQAEIHNKLREDAKKLVIFTYCIIGIWIIGIIILVIRFKLKNKNYTPDFNLDFFREIPYQYGPEILGYLLTKDNIENKYLSASIMELIRKKVFTITKNEKENWVIMDADKNNNISLSETEIILKKWLLEDIGNGESFTNIDLKDKSSKNADKFITNLNNWKNTVIEEGNKLDFYEEIKIGKYVAYIVIGALICFLLIMTIGLGFIPIIITVGVTIISLCMFNTTKKSQNGANHYARWIGLKKFMLEFGRMNEKELPEVYLWEKYLVYATSLGIADQVEKDLKVRLNNMNNPNLETMPLFYYNNIYMGRSIDKAINSSVTKAISTFNKANSISSSSSGFGGGASFGGGGGGFGGGGGRG